ncbi:phage tail protein [Limimaricola variabilis]|uniref:phage tail-collar fiber domain-containing protein n=1 Tax=Limimaricola variabilis TaxID=1492771 RepID=UPI002AC9C798|nr:phage tail protein [Limimaricola variabilis]WPY95594.1 phage tail protein [Limimaricola variabilis]
MAYSTIHTNAGLRAMYESGATGTQLSLFEMAVGDGGGQPMTPDPAQTVLAGEVYRAPVNRIFKPDPVNAPNKYAAELVVPASEGGFTLREVGVFDVEGALFAVGNLPETYKPNSAEGAYSDTVVRIEFFAENASEIVLVDDPNVTVATHQWALSNLTAAHILPGGTTSQVLAKRSNADGDVEWTSPDQITVVMATVEERQLLSAGQTQVDLTKTTTNGLAVYIDGERLPDEDIAEGWQADPVVDTRLHLGQSYPEGSEIIAVQNEPAGNFNGFLRETANLSDLPDKAAARSNLSVPSLTQHQQLVPPGAVMDFAMPNPPTGWLVCDGREVSRTTYAGLYNAIGMTFGAGNGVNTFRLPDFRGEFRRGWDNGRGVDAGRGFGTAQADELRKHTHTVKGNDAGDWSDQKTAPVLSRDDAERAAEDTRSISDYGGKETRPRNIAVLTCIKS